MNVLVTGASGQLGQSIKNLEKGYPDIQMLYTDVEELDITNKSDLSLYFEKNPIDYLINCAAYTAVDKAEEDTEDAFLLNATAVSNLVDCSNKYGFALIHISTDYVFSGEKSTPYMEEDTPLPGSVYGQSKLQGEKMIMDHCSKGIILRTSWLYSEYGNNFLKSMISLARERAELNIIFDQIGTPTYAGELAKAILELITVNFNDPAIFHLSNEGVASWFDFSNEIITLCDIKCKIRPIFTHEYPLPAKRPHYSLMSKRKFTSTFNYTIPHWKESLKLCLRNLKELE